MSVASPLPLDALVVGAIGIDTNVYLYGQDIDFSVEANFSQNRDYVGQAGGYTSRGYAQLGYRTGFIGYVGEDFGGSLIRQCLDQDRVESLLFVDPEGSRRSVNLMYRDGRRKNFFDARGAMRVHPDLAACRSLLSRARLVHMHIENWCRELLPEVKARGIPLGVDLQDMVTLDDPYRRDFIEAADILFCSAVNFPDPAPLIWHLLQGKPSRVVVVGQGSRGAVIGTVHGLFHRGPFPMQAPVVDTNGAGDGLAVGFLSSYVLEGYPLDKALERAQVVARHTCTQVATTDQLITRDELEARWQAGRG